MKKFIIFFICISLGLYLVFNVAIDIRLYLKQFNDLPNLADWVIDYFLDPFYNFMPLKPRYLNFSEVNDIFSFFNAFGSLFNNIAYYSVGFVYAFLTFPIMLVTYIGRFIYLAIPQSGSIIETIPTLNSLGGAL